MILDLDIDSLGVIDHATLPLGPGFTAITGETGAGKTMVVTALGLLLGGRARSGTIRHGRERASIDARWNIPRGSNLEHQVLAAGGTLDELDEETSELLITRQLVDSGRSKAWLGGKSIPVGMLTELGEDLVAVHGQAEQWRLRSESAQRDALDRFGAAEIPAVLAAVADAWDAREAARMEVAQLRQAEHDRRNEAEALRVLVDLVETLEPQPGEDQELRTRIDRLTHLDDIRRDSHLALEALRGREDEFDAASALSLLASASDALARAAANDSALRDVHERLENARLSLDDVSLDLASYLAELDDDGAGELQHLHERLARLNDLTTRFGPELSDVLTRYEEAGRRLLELDGDDDRIAMLLNTEREAEQALTEHAARLSTLREHAAQELASRVSEELTALAMPHARLEVRVSAADEVKRHGGDRIEFLLAANPGAAPVALGQGASGGELSRIMLALEVVLAEANPVPTLVFDEVDAGVGGAAAIEIGRRLQQLSRHTQVIVVTHLAQVAAFANNHLQISKNSDGNVTSSHITPLVGGARVDEITRLLSGLAESDTGRAHAEELLTMAATKE